MDPSGKKVGTGDSPKIRCEKAKIRKAEKRVKTFRFHSIYSIANLSNDLWFSFVICDTMIVEIKKYGEVWYVEEMDVAALVVGMSDSCRPR